MIEIGYTNLTGTSFAQTQIRNYAKVDQQVIIRHEPSEKYPNALRVYIQTTEGLQPIGFIPEKMNDKVGFNAEVLEKINRLGIVDARIVNLPTHPGFPTIGVNIHIQFGDGRK